MGDLCQNLSRREMACACGCGFDTVDIELVGVIQATCYHFADQMGAKVTLIVTGPNRCPAHNAETPGASKGSFHQFARAMDFKLFVDGNQIPPMAVYTYLCGAYPGKYGVGLYSNRVHLDTRSNGPARWENN